MARHRRSAARAPAKAPLRKPLDVLRIGREVLQDEARAVAEAAAQLNGDFTEAVRRVAECEGRLVVTGMGKANFVAQKISATFASTGTPSLFLHPADALHGDLGRLIASDVVLALSHSGETDEILRLLPPVRQVGATVLAITASKSSSLAQAADLTIAMGRWEEAGSGLAPTTSTTVMLALGDAMAMAVLRTRGFTADDFAQFHPGGSIGKKLMRVREVMRSGDMLPLVKEQTPLGAVISTMTVTAGRPGASMVVDRYGRLSGMFTDGDLRRLAETRALDLDARVANFMCKNPKTVRPEQLVTEASEVLRANRIDQVAVVDDKRRPVGLLDVQDLLALRLM